MRTSGNMPIQKQNVSNEMRTCATFANTDVPAWKNDSGYHGRSLAETAMFRYNPTIFGGQLSTRLIETQTNQALIRCAALNTMTHLGMPQSYKIA